MKRLALFACATLLACGSDKEEPKAATQQDLQQRVPPLVIGVVDESADAIQMVEQSPSWDLLGDTLSVAFPSDTGTVSVPGALARARSAVRRLYIEHLLAQTLEDRSAGQRATEFLLDELFANYEGDGVWRVDGAAICAEECSGGLPGPGTGPGGFSCMPDPTCLQQIADMEIRIRITLGPQGGLDFTLIVGPNRDEVLMIELRPESIKVSVDLAAVKGAITHVASVLGEMPMLPDVLEGRGSVTFRVNGRRDVTFEAAVEQAIRVEMNLAEGPFKVSLDATDPTLQVRVRDADPVLAVRAAVGRIQLSGPLDQEITGLLAIDVAGLSGEMELGRSAESVTIRNVGLGDQTSELKLDGQRLLGVDLNAEDGRRLAVQVTPEGESARIALDPKLDLGVDTRLQALADQGQDVPEYFRGQTYRLLVSGPPVVVPIEETATTPGALKVVEGMLELSSNLAPGMSVVVGAGMCLVEDMAAPGEHPLLGRFAAAACP